MSQPDRATTAAERTAALESSIQRNPHREDLSEVQARRPDWDESAASSWKYTKPRVPGWQFGDGAIDDEEQSASSRAIEVDPYAPGSTSQP